MTARIIYHDFRNEKTAKEPRIVKIVSRLNAILSDTCLFLCGACTAIGILVIVMATIGL